MKTAKLTPHITVKESYYSETAKRFGINNEPNAVQLAKLTMLGNNIFEPVRNHFRHPIKINSMFRTPEINKKIGGSPTSQHCKAEAMDIDDTLGGLTNKDMFYFIAENLDFDQLIWEFGNADNPEWVHVSYKGYSQNRNKITIAYKHKKRTMYKHFTDIRSFEIFRDNLYK